MDDKRIFKNTYITGSGRQNYLRIDHLEDPLFTSFTFDIDYITSPLFYTINYDNYGYPDVKTEKIKGSLENMYASNMGTDDGYDILPVFSASILDGNKLGFGLQQNVYMDKPLYGATEYIYMVDIRNGLYSQNDVRYDSNNLNNSSKLNTSNSYKLGGSVKNLVNESDKEWAEKIKDTNKELIDAYTSILGDSDVISAHDANKVAMENAKAAYEGVKGVEQNNTTSTNNSYGDLTNLKIQCETYINGQKKLLDEMENFIFDKCIEYNNKLNNICRSNGCIEYIGRYADTLGANFNDTINVDIPESLPTQQTLTLPNPEVNFESTNNTTTNYTSTQRVTITYDRDTAFRNEIIRTYGENYVNDYIYNANNNSTFCSQVKGLFDNFMTCTESSANNHYSGNNGSSLFLYDSGTGKITVRESVLIEQFGKDRLEMYGIFSSSENDMLVDFELQVSQTSDNFELFYENLINYLPKISGSNEDNVTNTMNMVTDIISTSNNLTINLINIGSVDEKTDKVQKDLDEYTRQLNEMSTQLYGTNVQGEILNASNPSPDSAYGKYLAAKGKYENDDWSQASRALSIAQSGYNQINGTNEKVGMLSNYNTEKSQLQTTYDASIQKGEQPLSISRTQSIMASQTVIDMLGFIFGMKSLTEKYPYIIQGIIGLDTAYNKHYGIKDPYLGSGEDKITLTCLESLDLRVSSMFNRYFNAVYDRQYRRERVPVGLRRFNCSVYVHDVRNFVSRMRSEDTYNRILELTDMYFGVIEFRFYDCEIVPEETGNIFDNITNEAPSEMKKTNFTFTYGNCVVNFIPPSEVNKHNEKNN